jgi:hypothetical protein
MKKFVKFTLVAWGVTDEMGAGEISDKLTAQLDKKEGIYSDKFNTVNKFGQRYVPYIGLTNEEPSYLAVQGKFICDTAKECNALLKEFKAEMKLAFKCKKIVPLLVAKGNQIDM